MAVIELLQSYLKYNEAMTRAVWESIRQITDAQFTASSECPHGSIRNLMIHMAVVDARWLRGLNGEQDARSYNVDPAGYPTIAAAYEFWESIAIQLQDYVRTLDEAQALGTPPGLYGPAWQVLLHLGNHGTDHRSQVLRALQAFGAPTFDQDFILYQWFRNK